MELYIDTLGGLDLDGSMDKNLTYFVVENLATIYCVASVMLLLIQVGRLTPSLEGCVCRWPARLPRALTGSLGYSPPRLARPLRPIPAA